MVWRAASATRIRHAHEEIAEEEVLLAGGAVSSPLLLLRSGVGDPARLAEHGIELVASSPEVGENLQDHLMVAVIMTCPQPVTLVDAETPKQLFRYLTQRRGLLTSNVGEAAAFIKTRADLPAPDIELIFAPVPYVDHGQVEASPGHGVTLGPVLLQPESRGSVRLVSTDPAAAPRIDPGYLQAGADLATMVVGVRQANFTEVRFIYLHLTKDRFDQPDGPIYTGAPPLRQKSDQDYLWTALAKGSVDVVDTDHVGYTRAEKMDPQNTITRARNGANYLQDQLPLL